MKRFAKFPLLKSLFLMIDDTILTTLIIFCMLTRVFLFDFKPRSSRLARNFDIAKSKTFSAMIIYIFWIHLKKICFDQVFYSINHM